MDKSLVLIHLGNHFFNYINDCIGQIKKFNDDKIFLIINECNVGKIIDKDVIIVSSESLPKTKNHINFDKNNNLDKEFRGGFWKFATERFLYIEDLMFFYGLENIFHLENDNLIFFDLDEYIDFFNSNYELAVTFDNDFRAIPGFVYIKNLNSITKLNSFINNNPNRNDMELLSEYRNYVNKVFNLPILPSNYDSELITLTGNKSKKPNQYFNNFDYFNSIFDAAAIGQFLGGIDQRNVKHKLSTEGFINESSFFNPNYFKFIFKIDNRDRKIPYLIYKDSEIRINNLHIHSKNLKKFVS
jgi:hypothetical protein